jgi:ATP-binding cassette subfamily B protein/subfamily B ATP-binding cassette protein MsbA
MPTLIRLLKELAPFKKDAALVFISGLFFSLLTTQFAVLLKNMMDSLSNPKLSTLYEVAAMIFILATLIALVRYYHSYLSDILVDKVIIELRLKLQEKLLHQSPNTYMTADKGSGNMISHILNDMMIIQYGLRYFVDLIREPITLTLLLGWLFFLNWKLTLSILIVLPLLLEFMKKLSQSVSKYSRQGQEQMEKVTQNVKENLDGARVIQSFTLENYALKKLQQTFQDYFQTRRNLHSRIHLAGPMGEWIAMVVGLGVILSIAAEIQSGRATFGDFTSYLGALLMLNRPIKALQDGAVRVQEVKVAASRLYEILDAPIQIQDKPEELEFPKDFQTITFENIHFQYQDTLVLKGISFQIKKGQSIALVGSSGSGKSTLINLLPRFFDPTQGRVLIDSIDIRGIRLQSLRENIALVTQDVYLFSGSISENIQTGNLKADPSGISSAMKKASADEFIEKMPQGLHSSIGERGQLLSGGEKQRLSIARAIFKDAPILIFDEATSNLDAKNEAIILDTIKSFTKNKTSLIVAHRLSSILHCDQILVLENGEVVESGRHQKLMEKRGYYYRLALSQGLS